MNTKDHYSYRIYANPEIARNFDSDRFGGGIGDLIKRSQETVVFSVLPTPSNWKVIDVGAGTGRFTIPFLQAGAEVTACDASEQMLGVLQDKVRDSRLQIQVADAHNLQFHDRHFDCAISFRMLLHVVDWKKALSELCRVSGSWVVFDIPPRHGFLLLAPVFHRVKSFFSKDVQSYRIFSLNEVAEELRKNGFEIVHRDFGFFLPLIIHRTISSVSFTRNSERLFRKARLTQLVGSPVTIFARRIQ